MAPFLIGVGGAHSKSGKTALICRLLKALEGWGAVKCTPTPLYSSVTNDPDTIGEDNTDTGRYIEAGAADVLWVRSSEQDMQETLNMAIDSLSHLKGIIVEGNSAIEVLTPDVIIFNAGEPEKSKKNADRVLMMADIVVFEHEPPANAPGKSRKFHSADWEEIIRCVTEAVGERRG